MNFRRMTEAETARWYREELCTAFAAQECKPLEDIFSLIRAGRYEIWGLFDEEALLGYAAIWKSPEVPLLLLDYLGVTASRRNAGLGTELLSRLKARGQPLILESEIPVAGDGEEENRIRRRRMAFYRRNGFCPVYRMATCGLAWQALLYDPEGSSPDDVMRWHRALYGPERTDVQVPLGDGETPQMPYWMNA